jgi:hypothetical protein
LSHRPAPRHRRRLAPRTRRIIGGLATVALTLTVAFAVQPGDAAVTAAPPPSPGRFSGYAFDACTAPPDAAMDAWLASPYRAVGVYFGGINRGCTQANLSAAWVARQQSKGWKIIPVYVGLQAPCRVTSRPKIDPAQAAAQGTSQANDAVAQATLNGLGKGSVLIFDMEAYPVPNAACTAAVQTFMSAYTVRLHQLGYFSGFYSSMASGVADMVSAYNRDGFTRPDFIDFARWDGVDTLTDPGIPDTYWTPGRRMKQYRGGHDESWGGVTINVDTNRADFLPAVTTPFGDSTGDGWSDVVAKDTLGALWLYPGDGGKLGARRAIATNWTTMNAVVRAGDFNKRGYEDVIGRQRGSGNLYLYPGKAGGGITGAVFLGTGFAAMREITPIGDLNRDGYRDLLTVRSATGQLLLYPGRGSALGSPVVIGTGWNDYVELAGGGDYDRDGQPDLVAREKATGDLYLFASNGAGGLQDRVLVGTGYGSLRDITAIGDFDRDGYPDVVAVDTGSLRLYLYPGTPQLTIGPQRYLSRGWTSLGPVA